MSTSLARTAEARLAVAPTAPQRYGLSVFLRKAYPELKNRQQSTITQRKATLSVLGAKTREVAWSDLPADVVKLVQQRTTEDSFVAENVLTSPVVQVTSVSRTRTPLTISMRHGVGGKTTPLFVDVGPGATVAIEEAERRGLEREEHAFILVLLRVGEGATVRWLQSSVGASGFTIIERLALLARDAVLEHHSALVDSNAMRDNMHVVLREPGATVKVRTLFVGSADNQFDLGVTAEHRAPRTVSDLRAKGALSGTAQGVYRGLVRVTKNASGSDGYQRCDALLLSPTAEVDPVPTLEINTNDVRCTHGVTVSHVNAEQMFYLQSRGMTEAVARSLFVEGFAVGMLAAYPEAERAALRASVRQSILGER